MHNGIQEPSWKDSYKANGFCWCDTTYDHNLGSKTLKINNRNYNIRRVCEELEKHPLFRDYSNGDIPYNDIQCGNGPVNDSDDEEPCPGRVDIGSTGCNKIGPRYDMNWLKSRSIFGGDDDDDGNTSEIGLKAENGKYLSSENGRTSMTANRNGYGKWEKFTLISLGGRSYALRANNGKYVSSENGKRDMTASRNSIGSWEKFTIVNSGGNNYSLRGNNNKYVSLQYNFKLMCTSSGVSATERFNIPTGLNRASKTELSEASYLEEKQFYIKNPILSEDLISVSVPEVTNVVVYTYDGRKIGSFKSSENFTIDTSGFYIIEFVLGENKSVRKKIVVK